jgi:hypothetical protein
MIDIVMIRLTNKTQTNTCSGDNSPLSSHPVAGFFERTCSMVISEKYGRYLVRNGEANEAGVFKDGSYYYMAIARFEQQRTDHYQLLDGDRELKKHLKGRAI